MTSDPTTAFISTPCGIDIPAPTAASPYARGFVEALDSIGSIHSSTISDSNALAIAIGSDRLDYTEFADSDIEGLPDSKWLSWHDARAGAELARVYVEALCDSGLNLTEIWGCIVGDLLARGIDPIWRNWWGASLQSTNTAGDSEHLGACSNAWLMGRLSYSRTVPVPSLISGTGLDAFPDLKGNPRLLEALARAISNER